MRDDETPDRRPAADSPEAAPPDARSPATVKGRVVHVAQRLEQTKVTVTTVLLFMVFLAVLSGAAAAIGYASHHFLRR